MNYYIIFQMIPENLKVFKFRTLDQEKVALYESCHNRYVNSEEDEEMCKETEQFLIELSESTHDKNLVFNDDFLRNKDLKKAFDVKGRIIVCGFIL